MSTGARIAQRLTRLFSQTITLKPWTGQNDFGEATYGQGTTHRAHVQQAVARTNGSQAALPGLFKVIIGEPVKVDPRDQLVLPEEYGTRDDNGDFESPTTRIAEVHYLNDSRGHVATTIICGRG